MKTLLKRWSYTKKNVTHHKTALLCFVANKLENSEIPDDVVQREKGLISMRSIAQNSKYTIVTAIINISNLGKSILGLLSFAFGGKSI